MKDYSVFNYTPADLSALPARPEESHKGTFGKVLCVCGSEGMTGAAYFAAKGAYRMGAGLVKILTPRQNLPVLATLLPEALLCGYDTASPEADRIDEAGEWADVLVIGCGLGVTPASRRILSRLLRTAKKPTVLDADALNLLARNPSLLPHAKGAILTPHAMELSRLWDRSADELMGDPAASAYEFAKAHGLICVLKGHRTAVSDGGALVYRNTTGNSGMATGGSGDVLAGIIGGLLATARLGGPDPFACACLGVYLHGLCGDRAAARLSEYSVMASDLLDALPDVLKNV